VLPNGADLVTYSIVARDPDSGQLGVAVATAVLAVGRSVPWARPGVGAIATQAQTNRMYGATGLDLLATGMAPEDVLAQLLAADAEAADRQVAILDSTGRVAAWTGGSCVPACGHVRAEGVSVQGNMLVSRSVVPSMAAAYAATAGPLPERLLASLRAAEDAGGDLRGRQSAALVVVVGPDGGDPAVPVDVDLRVDGHAQPLAELDRLLRLQRAYESGDWERLRHEAPAGLGELYGALAAAQRGDRDRARAAVAELRQRPGWDTLLRRMHAAGRLPHAGELLD
jgi:uncharacterized Ntn-hydrolase superfamily protein